MILAFALVGGVIAFLPIPGTSVVLIGLEVFLLYRIQAKHNAFDLGAFIAVAAGLAGVSAVLKTMASALTLIPVIGWMMSAAIAFGFIMIFGHIADGHYSKLALRDR